MSDKRNAMSSLDGPSDDGLIPPDPEDLLEFPIDPEVLLETRRAEIREAAAKEASGETVPDLSIEEENEVVDLINAGRKEIYFNLFNRNIHMRTLSIGEELEISDITKPYIGSDGYPRAYRTAVVAAAVRSIDGKLLFNPISESEFKEMIAKKFEVLMDYYPLAVDQMYARYRDMELELMELVEKLGKS